MGCARRACRVSLNPSTRRSPTAWAWASRSAARLLKPMVGGCGRPGASRGVLSFSLRSPLTEPPSVIDVAYWPIVSFCRCAATASPASAASGELLHKRRRGGSSKLPGLHFLEFVAAHGAEALQQIDCAVACHFAQFDEAPVRLQIGVQDFSGNVFGAVDH